MIPACVQRKRFGTIWTDSFGMRCGCEMAEKKENGKAVVAGEGGGRRMMMLIVWAR